VGYRLAVDSVDVLQPSAMRCAWARRKVSNGGGGGPCLASINASHPESSGIDPSLGDHLETAHRSRGVGWSPSRQPLRRSGKITRMRSVASALCAALFALNAQAALLHVHLGGDEHHAHHGPAAHQHQIKVRHHADHTEVGAPNEDDTAVPVALVKATPMHAHLFAIAVSPVRFDDPAASQAAKCIVTARAHGPPTFRPASPRGPPRNSRL